MFSFNFREREKGRGIETSMWEKYGSVASCICPHQGQNPQPIMCPDWELNLCSFCAVWCSNQLSHTCQGYFVYVLKYIFINWIFFPLKIHMLEPNANVMELIGGAFEMYLGSESVTLMNGISALINKI